MPSKYASFEAAVDALMRRTEQVTETGCLLYLGCVDKDGYGKGSWRNGSRNIYLAHRAVWELHNGAIPHGLEIDHICRVPGCVNINHLQTVTHSKNIERSLHFYDRHRNGKKTHCIRGHALDGENLMVEVWRGIRMRKCRACRYEAQRRRYAMRKAA